MSNLLYIIVILINCTWFYSFAQVGTFTIIDDSSSTLGITHIHASDVNNDNRKDIIVSQASSIDRVTIYLNQGNDVFSKSFLDLNINDPQYVLSHDFNNDGWSDVVVLTQSDGDLFFYKNNNGAFSPRDLIGNVQGFGKAVEVADFDQDGDDDLVVIGQHSIDLYRNDGQANFVVEPILTTSSSPNILECFDLISLDFNNDGFMDIITGETLGLVAYENDGTGTFTASTISESQHHTITAISHIDANGDSKPDIVFHSTSTVGVYLNQSTASTTQFNYYDQLISANSNSINRIQTADITQNGFDDIYYSTQGVAYLLEQTNSLSFSAPDTIYHDPNKFIWETEIADLTNIGSKNLVWAAAGGTLAYHRDSLANLNDQALEIKIYPNPSDHEVFITSSVQLKEVFIQSISGRAIKKIGKSKGKKHVVINTDNFTPGVYLLTLKTYDGALTKKKILVQ